MDTSLITHPAVQILNHEIVYQGHYRLEKYYLKFKKYSGKWSEPVTREVFERGNAAAVLLYDPILDQVVLIEQFRVGALEEIKNSKSPWLLEIVAGVIAQDERAEDVILRESKEEAGISFDHYIKICDCYVSPGASTECVSIFCAKIDAKKVGGVHGLVEEQEDILTLVMDIEEAFNLLQQNKIKNAVTLIALQWLQINQSSLKKQWLIT